VEVVTGFGQGEVRYRCLCLMGMAVWSGYDTVCSLLEMTEYAYNVDPNSFTLIR
jgi:hypothetical protein